MSRRNARRRVLPVALLLGFALIIAACGGGESAGPSAPAPEATTAPAIVGDATAGEQVYRGTCQACHGPDGAGIEGLGKTLHPSDSEFIRANSDDDLVQYIIVGRTPDDPLNTTGVGMPARGGNPALSEQDLYDVVSFIRTLD